MKHLLLAVAAAVTFQLGTTPLAHAQTSTPTAAYTGPRYPGGPDSLRALLHRSTRLAAPGFTGRARVEFELKPDGQPHNFSIVRPPEPLRQLLVDATATALTYLEAHMPAWQPALPDPGAKADSEVSKIGLTLDFGKSAAAQPYNYADQYPIFATIGELLRTQRSRYASRLLADPAQLARIQSSPSGLVTMIQLLVVYPAEALRSRQQGTVYAYFEVTEIGAIEHTEILGTAGQALDAEVLRALTKLPAATTPAQLQGRPVRVSYVVPVTFKYQ